MSRQNNGGRIIQIQNSAIVSYEYLPFPNLTSFFYYKDTMVLQ